MVRISGGRRTGGSADRRGRCRLDDWLTQILATHGLTILYGGTLALLLLCGLGLPFPEEATFLAAGYAAAKIPSFGPDTDTLIVHLVYLCFIGVAGIVAGDSVPFLLGKYYGRQMVKRPFFKRLLTAERLERTKEFFRKHGSKAVFSARFVAGLRMPAFFIAASLGVRYRVFVLWDTLGALISCPTSIVAAYFLGPYAEEFLATYKMYALGFAVGLVVGIVIWRLWWRKKKAEPDLQHPALSAPGLAQGASPAQQAERALMRQ